MSGALYTCCGNPADGSSGTVCDHRRGRVVTRRRWRQLSHGAVGPWRPDWTDRGTMCAMDCDCRDEAEDTKCPATSAT